VFGGGDHHHFFLLFSWCFVGVLGLSSVILGLLATSLFQLCVSIDHSPLLNEKRAICLVAKKKKVLMRYFWVSDIMIVGRTSYNKLLQPVVSQCGLPYA
jgi:hypothetical protein